MHYQRAAANERRSLYTALKRVFHEASPYAQTHAARISGKLAKQKTWHGIRRLAGAD